jgi:hypothetical protein
MGQVGVRRQREVKERERESALWLPENQASDSNNVLLPLIDSHPGAGTRMPKDERIGGCLENRIKRGRGTVLIASETQN